MISVMKLYKKSRYCFTLFDAVETGKSAVIKDSDAGLWNQALLFPSRLCALQVDWRVSSLAERGYFVRYVLASVGWYTHHLEVQW